MTDFHSHILPHMDDGASSLETACEMLRMSASQGVDRIVATPHFYPDSESPDSFLEKRNSSIRRLQSGLEEGMPSVFAGAEVAYFRGIGRSEYLSSLCIIGTKTVLIEMPFEKWTENVIEDVLSLPYLLGLDPVIAHIERYAAYQEKDTLDRLIGGGIRIQSNASVFSDFFSKHKAVNMLSEGRIHVLGSDCHNTASRAPNMERAVNEIEKRLGKEALGYLEENAGALLSSAIPIG